jgi:uncharacterized protein YjbI with pentapeptide repeats
LRGLNIYESLNIDPKSVEWRDFIFDARNRNLRGAVLDNSNLPKVDFTSADLQEASLNLAQLQMASLDGANLQGASLLGAKLQGANLLFAKLQGASLDSAQLQGSLLQAANLQGARINNANLQGASLNNAMLQGASLWNAELQGATLFAANLQGASLEGADLRGAFLENAQLQGATLQEAVLRATDLKDSLLWRTNSAPPSFLAPAANRLPDAAKSWGPLFWATSSSERRPWNDESYGELRKTLDSLPMNEQRIEALKRIQRLDCANPDATLTFCDPAGPPSPEADTWRSSLEESRVGDDAYFRALASELRTAVCVGFVRGGMFTGGRGMRLLDYAFIDDAVFVLRGLMASNLGSSRLADAGPETPALIDFIVSKDCPVSDSLSDAVKARLLQIKQDVIERSRHR